MNTRMVKASIAFVSDGRWRLELSDYRGKVDLSICFTTDQLMELRSVLDAWVDRALLL